MIEIYQWEISPYCEKIRKICDYKELEYKTIEQPLLKRETLLKHTGQQKVPVIRDGERWVADSTDIALYLEQHYPDRPVLPSDARDRRLCLLIEDWADEALASTVQPTKWLTPGNMSALLAELRRNIRKFPNRLLARASGPALKLMMKTYTHGRSAKQTRAQLDHQLDLLEDALADRAFLFGEAPSLADFAVASLMHHFRGLSGYEEVTRRKKLSAMLDRIEALPSKRAVRDSEI